jgi:hypothetical protein
VCFRWIVGEQKRTKDGSRPERLERLVCFRWIVGEQKRTKDGSRPERLVCFRWIVGEQKRTKDGSRPERLVCFRWIVGEQKRTKDGISSGGRNDLVEIGTSRRWSESLAAAHREHADEWRFTRKRWGLGFFVEGGASRASGGA